MELDPLIWEMTAKFRPKGAKMPTAQRAGRYAPTLSPEQAEARLAREREYQREYKARKRRKTRKAARRKP